MTNKHLKDADMWLQHCKTAQDENPRVACAMAVHAVIKSLDALFERYCGETPGRHDSATGYFKDLIKQNHIDAAESKYTNTIQNMLQKKADAQYKAAYFSENDAEKWVKQATRIHRMARSYLTED